MAKVLFKRIEDSTHLENLDIEDGSFIITGDGKNYIDYGDTRVPVNGTPDAPVGVILPYAGIIIPDGWLLCDGSEVSRTTYSYLYYVIRNTYGSGDGSTTFNLPNLKGRIPVGLDSNDTDFDTLGETGGEKEHILSVNELPSHTHGENINSSSGAKYPYTIAGGGGSTKAGNYISSSNVMSSFTGPQNNTDSTGGGQGHNIVQPYIVMNYIIKY